MLLSITASQLSPPPCPEEIANALLTLAKGRRLARLARALDVDVSDATNTAVIRALTAIATYSPAKGPLDVWLLAILRNAIYEIGRQVSRDRARASTTLFRGDLPQDRRQLEALDLLLAREQAAQVRDQLAAAGPFVQEIAQLRDQGLPFRQVAERMGVALSLVTNRWFAWRRSAKRALTSGD